MAKPLKYKKSLAEKIADDELRKFEIAETIHKKNNTALFLSMSKEDQEKTIEWIFSDGTKGENMMEVARKHV